MLTGKNITPVAVRVTKQGVAYTLHVFAVVFTLNRSFYPTTSAVPPVSFLILHPREIQIMWSQTETEKTNAEESR